MNDKRSAEYVGAFKDCVPCQHLDKGICAAPEGSACLAIKLPDFTTPDGWQLIADKIKEKGEWNILYHWYAEKNFGESPNTTSAMFAAAQFHELPPPEKSALFIEWLKEKEDDKHL